MTYLVERQIKAIDEQWKANHLTVMACWEFGDLLLFCVEAFEHINRVDEAWREDVLSKGEPYDADIESKIGDVYRSWFETCRHFLDALRDFQNRQYEVEHANKFMECLQEAEDILREDSDFFSGDGLADLRDAAIDEHQRGETLDGSW